MGSLGYTRPPNAAKDIPTSDIARFTVGAMFDRYKQMIGYFGWLDTPSPALTYVLWTAGLGFLVLVALAWARRRQVTALLVVLAATVVVPVTLESAAYGDAGGPAWQGRYGLPLAVGVPIVAAFAIASSERGRQIAEPRVFVGAGVMLVVAHILAFAQNLRRYTVGYNGEIQYWRHAEWSPPLLSPLLVTIAYALLVTAFVVWYLYAASPRPTKSKNAPRARAALRRGQHPRIRSCELPPVQRDVFRVVQVAVHAVGGRPSRTGQLRDAGVPYWTTLSCASGALMSSWSCCAVPVNAIAGTLEPARGPRHPCGCPAGVHASRPNRAPSVSGGSLMRRRRRLYRPSPQEREPERATKEGS